MFEQMKKDADRKAKRWQHRLPMSTPLSLELGDTGTSFTVQNQDISWGGVRFAAPKEALSGVERVTLKFPWAKGEQFSAAAKVVRTEPLDDERDLVAARFSNLSASDQRRLEKLLNMLSSGADAAVGADEQGPKPLVPVLEVLLGDAEEMRDKLSELAEGRLTITVVETYEVNQSISLVLSDTSDLPALQLRARVSEIEPLSTDSETAWPMFDVQLAFEHPLHELERAARSRMERVQQRRPVVDLDGKPMEANPYLLH